MSVRVGLVRDVLVYYHVCAVGVYRICVNDPYVRKCLFYVLLLL